MVVVFFPALFILCVCVHMWSMARTNYSCIQAALSVCASHTTLAGPQGPALALPQAPQPWHSFERCPAPSCGLARKMLLYVESFYGVPLLITLLSIDF